MTHLPHALVLLTLLTSSVTQASAATVAWKPNRAGAWTDGSNWETGRVPEAGDDVVITAPGAKVLLAQSTPALRSVILGGTLTFAGLETKLTAGTLAVKSGGIITHEGPFKQKTNAARMLIHCTGTLVVEPNAMIDVDAKGYAGGIGNARDEDPTSAGFGPGAGGFPKVWGASAGGSHGGKGGTPSAVNTYGSATEPIDPGSGGGGGNKVGGGAGGGAIRITARHVVIDGLVSSCGGDGVSNSYGGGGSGGSVLITCETIVGHGEVRADGGGGSIYAGGGGGGRISVVHDPKQQSKLAVKSQISFSTTGGSNGRGMWGTWHARHFGEPGTFSFTNAEPTGRLVPQTGLLVGGSKLARAPRELTVAYWMPWAVNKPIVTVKKVLNLKHPKPRQAAMYWVEYVGPKLEMMNMQAVEERDDVADAVRRRFSTDNGKTWSKFEPQLSSAVRYGSIEASEGSSTMVYDPRSGVLVRTWLRQLPIAGRYHNASYVSFSRDLGRTWTPHRQLRYELGDDFDPKDPGKPGFINKNQGYAGQNILVHSNGTLITVLSSANAPGDPENDSRPWRMGSLCFIGTWDRQRQDYVWTPGQRVAITPKQSVRGLLEPEAAELKGGRVLVVWRGANAPGPEGGNARATSPGCRWYSVSDDGGRTLSPVRPWKYDDGTLFYTPSSSHRMLRHSKTGKLYWFGNISPVPPLGNSPRFPLVMAEVDETIPALKRDTVTLIDDRDENKHGFFLQLSNFSLHEDRETHEIVLYLTTYGQERDEADWATADNYRYTLTLK